ncbi:TPR and ankyrin repeat-containing protein 1 AltName: Full=Lupus brain antigen 1 homolog [Rhizoctonia solani AG-1 IB]|uniref:Rhizoctonia solani AG1-IB WGS project CAOJ00000000 data, isolate 7/3/14, contig 17795 n=1 Tax=Thanatephorus cucumeris (strain AG1-IB / isolate 7/3/14) TaxID=1108050 RepID=M5C399_THACB|nr:TPR and ankyrin repeat-containing protein 1 AltName: Full=Lupus brain antigen 1 homolog [Rhizoctonia solani AG-1 IB]
MADKDLLDLHSLIALEKFIPMSRSLIDAILNDSDSNHVFQVSAKEKEIIYHDSACFVLGRSGTGKTTSIVFKMIGIEKLFEQMEEMAKPRQVFVTQSRVLAQRVQEYYQSLVGDTSHKSNNLNKSDEDEDEEHVLADLDDEDASVFGLPPKYSMLEDRHFPLFVTFDQLCSLLEADFGLQFKRLSRTKAHAAAEKRFALSEVEDVKINLDQDDEVAQEDTDKLSSPTVETTEQMLEAKQAAVTFEVFVAAYWPHFDYQLKKGLDPALVYSEFLGIIEGSEAALLSKAGALSRDEYTGLSHKKSSFASQRGYVYDLYEAYRKRKRQLRGYDAAERTHALVVETSRKVPGLKFDCLYIDEAQDNLLIDMKLLHNLSNNPHGIFVAGDTAQTISAGSSFRFEDLKAFMWRLEEKDEAVRCGKRKAIHPALFHLALISDLFPYSIDKLKKETGITDGPKPVFFSGWERGVVRFEQFLRGEAETKIDFGASQVILVRNEAARNALREQVGEIGLILTLYESKGLEFDDVLLYNFFEDSVPNESTWRVILQGLHMANIGPVPRFDEIRHAVICTELKNLANEGE